jgi:glycosyltransferase involved in cell wall biosynthesis
VSVRPIVLTVGRLVEKKGHDTLLRAAAVARDRGHDFRLRIAGEGAEWSALQRLVHALDLDERVTFLGPLSEAEIRREYERADLFALACRELENGDRDGIPNVVLEAMAHSLPIVSTLCGGISEAVEDGESGLLAPQEDVEAFADLLTRLIAERELRERLGAAGRERALTRFDRRANLPTVVEALAHTLQLAPANLQAGREEAPTLQAVA